LLQRRNDRLDGAHLAADELLCQSARIEGRRALDGKLDVRRDVAREALQVSYQPTAERLRVTRLVDQNLIHERERVSSVSSNGAVDGWQVGDSIGGQRLIRGGDNANEDVDVLGQRWMLLPQQWAHRPSPR
jgi:hypothetical protein